MRTKSSIRIMMTIIMKVVPLMPIHVLRAGYTPQPFYLLFRRAAKASWWLKLVLVEHPPERRGHVLFDEPQAEGMKLLGFAGGETNVGIRMRTEC